MVCLFSLIKRMLRVIELYNQCVCQPHFS